MNQCKEYLFDDMPPSNPRVAAQTFKQIERPVWTESKANLIQRYLKNFTYVTKHGTYIDGFAGPQRPEAQDMWAAKLVLETQPHRLRNYFFFEQHLPSVDMLTQLIACQSKQLPGQPKRRLKLYPGDFNTEIHRMLKEFPIKDTEATFCLLDQRTRECDWASVEAIATHKRGGNRIELFYFLPHAWIDRSIGKLKDKEGDMKRWWGDSGWKKWIELRGHARGKFMADRFQTDLGYKYAYAYPIYGRSDGGKTMYFMVHATDHPDATALMFSAYRGATGACPRQEQMQLITGQI